jgi:hypothetical protein
MTCDLKSKREAAWPAVFPRGIGSGKGRQGRQVHTDDIIRNFLWLWVNSSGGGFPSDRAYPAHCWLPVVWYRCPSDCLLQVLPGALLWLLLSAHKMLKIIPSETFQWPGKPEFSASLCFCPTGFHLMLWEAGATDTMPQISRWARGRERLRRWRQTRRSKPCPVTLANCVPLRKPCYFSGSVTGNGKEHQRHTLVLGAFLCILISSLKYKCVC